MDHLTDRLAARTVSNPSDETTIGNIQSCARIIDLNVFQNGVKPGVKDQVGWKRRIEFIIISHLDSVQHTAPLRKKKNKIDGNANEISYNFLTLGGWQQQVPWISFNLYKCKSASRSS